MTDYREQVGERIRERRMALGLTQEQLAARWTQSRHTVLRLEQGKSDPGLDVLAELARVLECQTLAELLKPILSPEQAAEERRRTGDELGREMWRTIEAERDRFLAGLDAPNARRVLYAVGRLAQSAPTDLAFLADMLEATANDRQRRARPPRPLDHWAPQAMWSPGEGEDE